jgi:membrane protease YdiL (CAAX protease family)
MQNEQDHPLPVPWKTRDVWLGVAFLILWWAIVMLASFLLWLFELEVNLGVFVGLAELLLLVPVWWLAVRKYRVGWDALGLRGFEGKMVGLGCGLMVLSFVFNFMYNIFLALFDLSTQVDLAPVFAELSSPWWLLLAGIIVAPVVEEVFFRGFVFAGLRRRYDWQKAALISSLLFALIHLQPTAIPPIFILGYIFAYLYERSGSIGPAILMHISTNGLALGAAYLIANMDLPA